MALFSISLFLLLALFSFPELCFSINPNRFNLSLVARHWGPAGATWYGSPHGAGSDGGSCGYATAVSQFPFSSLITAVGPSLYKAGKECGACYQVKCITHPSCSRKPVRVVITDSCPGGLCAEGSAHFDLSGTAFGAMAKSGQEKKLRDAGVLNIRFARVACDYSAKTVTFRVDPGSNSNYFSVVIEFEEGDGDLGSVALSEASSTNSLEWRAMRQSWGAVWKLDAGGKLQAPFSIQLRSRYSGKTIVAKNVIPRGWKPGGTYRSMINFL
ncbi:atexpb2 [Ranunculus cassubicifolius]